MGALSFASGNRLISASDDGIIRVWDTLTGKLDASWRANNGSVVSLAVSFDDILVTSGYDRLGIQEPWSLQQWDLRSKHRVSMSTKFGVVTALAFAPLTGHLFLGGPMSRLYAVQLPLWTVIEALH